MEIEGSLLRSQQPATCPCPQPDRVHAPFYSWRCILILSSHLHLGLPSTPFHADFTTKTLHPPVFSPIHATRPANLTALHMNPNKMWYTQITKLIIMQSFPFPCHLIPPPQLGQRRRYSDSLRAGRSGDQNPLGESFSATLSTVSGAHPATYKWVSGHSFW